MAYKFNPLIGIGLDDVGNDADAAAGGSDTQVQYNDGGSLAGSADLTWDDTGKELDVGGRVRASTGILFGTDTAAANTLDDYEEGTWIPRLSGTTGGDYTPGANNVGNYIKIGKLVWITATLHWTAAVTPYTGLLTITGLPFNVANISELRTAGSIGSQVVGVHTTGSFKRIAIGADPNQSFLYLSQIDDADTSGDNYSLTPTVLSSGTVFGITLVYRVT